MTIYLNHVGFTPQSVKFCLLGGPLETEFSILDAKSGKVVFRGRLSAAESDFGIYTRGEFSALTRPGHYVVDAGGERSLPFSIAQNVYEPVLQDMLSYFRAQRCGPAETGWNGPCHLDDGIRGDNRQRQDVSGGWHDANDLRKWVGATIYGMLGLLRLAQRLNPPWDGGQIEDELRWGNRYFLAMQEPAGYVMNHCGGDYFVHADNNRWTDNTPDGIDDRLIDTHPCDGITQWVFVGVQAGMAQLVRASDPAYSKRCAEAARRCLAWLLAEGAPAMGAGELGAALSALSALYRLDQNEESARQAAAFAQKLLELQVMRPEDTGGPIYGWFWARYAEHPGALEPYNNIWQGCWPLQGLCDLLETFSNHPDTPAWRAGIERFCGSYLLPLAQKNAFAMVPFGLFRSDPGGGKPAGRFFYRRFMVPSLVWYVGINANLASHATALACAARLLGQPEWAALAQRQLDWILGANPFNASTVMGSGYNNPQHMFSGGYYPPTPFLKGAVMNGISGDANDNPQLVPGEYNECEYWTPMVCYTMMLITEIG
jgi:hypothetical protein